MHHSTPPPFTSTHCNSAAGEIFSFTTNSFKTYFISRNGLKITKMGLLVDNGGGGYGYGALTNLASNPEPPPLRIDLQLRPPPNRLPRRAPCYSSERPIMNRDQDFWSCMAQIGKSKASGIDPVGLQKRNLKCEQSTHKCKCKDGGL